MKFLLEFVSCCRFAYRPTVTTTAPLPAEETRSLVPSQSPSNPPDDRRYRSRKRGRVWASRSGSAAEWRPSLHAISEDNVVVEREERVTVESERILKRKVDPTPRVHVRKYSNDFRRPAIIPSFSPTPFLF